MPQPWITAATHAVADLVFPERCALCAASTADQAVGRRGFCFACLRDLAPFDGPRCGRCALPRPPDASPSAEPGCPACRAERYAFDGAWAWGPYQGALRHAVLLAKRRSGRGVAAALGEQMSVGLADLLAADASEAPPLVAPIPSPWRRRVRRGVTPAEEIARSLARAARLPLALGLLRTAKSPARQASVAPSDRWRNVRGAFRVSERLRRLGADRIGGSQRLEGRTVLLVDDVLTTGATCDAAARALRKAGSGRVVAVVAARRVGGL
ncbi:DNA utilization protein GntX [Pseudobythopirellula maris]|uniref:DNA utilization protein GntX n=1 Tax=Pseudobythopirellula maris TaxID=2527991 RepID=A0A5C5ZLF5_9BACT|nr:phosphoribosyltransferase family protein [Pseudobythopirellula maris]TWT88229.1 DNA utilization protein GntX [Pseudobythopirellula maris]